MTHAKARLVICVHNDECVDLELRKVYPLLPDAAAAKAGYLRVIDESGEDYLYPADHFVSGEAPGRKDNLDNTPMPIMLGRRGTPGARSIS